MTNFNRTAFWLKACGKEQGNTGHITTQLGCVIEEFTELLSRIKTHDCEAYKLMIGATVELEKVAKAFKHGYADAYFLHQDRAEVLDAFCDIEVTVNGLAYLLAMDKEKADVLVLDSNDGKLVDGNPVILPGGKIGKPAGWRAPDLSGCV